MTVAFVGHEAGGGDGSDSTIVTTARTTATGNLNVVCVSYVDIDGTTISVSSVTDTAGNTYTPLTEQYFNHQSLQIFYAQNITGHASNVVTATLSSGTTYRAISADEFSGADISSPFDAEAGATNVSETMASSDLTTSVVNGMVVVYATIADSVTFSIGTGYTLIDGTMPSSSLDFFGAEYKITSGIISGVAQTIVSNIFTAGIIAVAAFKASSLREWPLRTTTVLTANSRASHF